MLNNVIHGYTITNLLGSGGMSDVYLAENKLGKKAAIKVLKPELNAFPEVRDRFEQEARIMVGLEHRHIRQAYDLSDVDGRPAMIMEYLEGQTLKDAIANGKLSEAKARKYFELCVEALKVTHEKGIVHRDIKPSNIFITRDDDIKIMDFGIAKVRETDLGTRTQQMLGTPVYMSPEQIRSPKNVTTQSDVYSLAVTFYHALSGRAPYDSTTDSDFEIQSKIVHEHLDLNHIPASWRILLSSMLIKEPNQRASINNVGFAKDEHTIIDSPPGEPPVPSGISVEKPSFAPKWIYFVLGGIVLVIGLTMASKSFLGKNVSNDDLVIYEQEGLFGYKNASGKVVIPARYNMASLFVEGIAEVSRSDSTYLINNKGLILKVVRPNWPYAGEELLRHSFNLLGGKNVGSYESFIDEFLQNEELRIAIWRFVSEEGKLGSYKSFLEVVGYPEDTKKNESAWLKAQESNTKSSYERYIDDYPNGRYVSEARSLVRKIESAENKEPESVQDEAAVAAAALQESITAFVDEVNAYKANLDAQIAAATDEAAKTSLTEMRMKLDQMVYAAVHAAMTVEEVDALKASFAEIRRYTKQHRRRN